MIHPRPSSPPQHYTQPTSCHRTTRAESGKVYAEKRVKSFKLLGDAMSSHANTHPERHRRILTSIGSPTGDLNRRSSQHAQLAAAAALIQFQSVLLLDMDDETFERHLNNLRVQISNNLIPPLSSTTETESVTAIVAANPSLSMESHRYPDMTPVRGFVPQLPLPQTTRTSTITMIPRNYNDRTFHQGGWGGIVPGPSEFRMHPGAQTPTGSDTPQVYTRMSDAQYMPVNSLPSIPMQVYLSDMGDHYAATGGSSRLDDPSLSFHANANHHKSDSITLQSSSIAQSNFTFQS